MPRDYKHRARKKPQKKPVSGWLWLLTGVLLGVFVAALVWMSGLSDLEGNEWASDEPDRPPQRSAPAPQRAEVPPPPKPRFDFYDMLPRMKVDVPAEPVEARVSPKVERLDSSSGTYLVQVASFKRNADAERVKAQLALLGIEARIETARIGVGDTRYRVRSGPYQGQASLERARTRLASNGFEAVTIPVDRR